MLKRLLLLIVLLVASGCDHWVEKLAPVTTGFARHCFDLLQKRDFAALETLTAPRLRTADLHARLVELAAQVPAAAPISSDAISVNVSTVNGYTTSTAGMIYQFQSGWLEFDITAEGSDDRLALTSIRLQPTVPPVAFDPTPILFAVPIIIGIGLVVIGVVVYRRRRAR
jgi:hypothetical protein